MEIKKYPLWFCTIIILITFISCEKESLIATSEKPVVQAYLIPGKPVQVKVNMQRGLVDTASYGLPITGLKISISDGTSTITLKESVIGQYSHNDKNYISTGKTYTLTFSYLNIEVSAKTTVPQKPRGLTISETVISIPQFTPGSGSTDTFIPVDIKWENPEKSDHLLILKNDEKYPSGLSNGGSPFGFGGAYRDIEINTGITTSYKIDRMTFRYVGYYTLYLYALNKEYVEILNASTSSSLNLTNPVTNIKNGIGIFTAMQADSLRLFVREK